MSAIASDLDRSPEGAPAFFADAQAALPFAIGQARNIEERVYARKYPASDYAAHIPVVTEGPEWAIGTTFFTVDTVGEAKFISAAANDMPMNAVLRDLGSQDFALIGSGWEWTIEEINQAAFYGVDLPDTKAVGAGEKVERLLHRIAMAGSTEKNWTGFVNDPRVSRVDVATTGVGGSRLWSLKLANNVLWDMNSLLTSIRDNSGEVEWADTIRLPPLAFNMLSLRTLGAPNYDTSMLDYFRKANVYTAETGNPLDIRPLRELANAGSGGTGRMIAYRRDPEVVRFHLPMPRRTLEPRAKSLMAFETGTIARTGGTEVRLPIAMAYADGMVPGTGQ